jgi:hypothetical protein
VDEADLVLDALDANVLPNAAPLAALLTGRDLADRSIAGRRAQRRHMLVGATLGASQLAKAAAAGVVDHGPGRYVAAAAAGSSSSSGPAVPAAATSSGLPGGGGFGGTALVTGRGLEAPMQLDLAYRAAPAGAGSATSEGAGYETPTVPSGLVHRVAAVEKWRQRGALVRLLRRDLDAWEADEAGDGGGADAAARRPRVVIFCKNDAEAKAVAPALRNALWGRHKIYALLPEDGAMPLQVLEQFAGAASASLEARSAERQRTTGDAWRPASGGKRDSVNVWGANTAPTVLLTTPVAARGLDFTNLTHVYSLDVLSGLGGAPAQSSNQAASRGGASLGMFMDAKAEYAHQV